MKMAQFNRMRTQIEKEVSPQALHKRTSVAWSKNDRRRKMKKMLSLILA